MSVQELLALYRTSAALCPDCRRIVSRYEKHLRLSEAEREHLENCVLMHGS